MAQSNYNIPNDSAPAVRAQLNSVFQSIASNNSGTSAPATTFPHQWWYDSTTNILKQRNAADSAWINIGTFDQTGGTFTPAGIVQLTQGQAENPASTVFGTVSGQRLAQAVDVNVTTTKVLTAIAGGNVGDVGTYAFLVRNSNAASLAPGSTVAGSELRYGAVISTNAYIFQTATDGTSGLAPGGTWRLMGHFARPTESTKVSLWLRIS
jgi:hypothetical protein